MDQEFDLDFDNDLPNYNSADVRRRKIAIALGVALLVLLVAVVFAGLGGWVGYTIASGSSGETSTDGSTSGSPVVEASASPSPSPVGNKLWQQLSLPGMQEHLVALQEVADRNNGTRSITSPGFNASIAFVEDTLRQHTDYTLTVQPFTVNLTVTTRDPVFEMTAPTPTNYTYPYEFTVLQFSGSGDLTETAVAAQNLGCNATDFADFPAGKIALIARGTCSFYLKVQNAMEAGALGALIYQVADETGSVQGTLGQVVEIPVFGLTHSLGLQFLSNPDATFHMSYGSEVREIFTSNLIAETKTGNPDAVVIVGSHLDSVDAGPGINDNGSGSSANLQMALQFQEVVGDQQVNQVRFIWYGAEEEGLLGSTYYVESLSEDEAAKVALNLNFDMLGSPNYMRGILNGTDSELPGSAIIMDTFIEFFDGVELPYKIIPFTGRSDYGPYLAAGIPAGGVETGAEVIKTPEERDVFGGLANAAYDPCYHQSCDTIANVDTEVLLQTAQAAAFALERFATKEDLQASLSRNQ